MGLLLERLASVRQTHEAEGRGARLQRVGDSRDRPPVIPFGGRFQIGQGLLGLFLEELRHLGDEAGVAIARDFAKFFNGDRVEDRKLGT